MGSSAECEFGVFIEELPCSAIGSIWDPIVRTDPHECTVWVVVASVLMTSEFSFSCDEVCVKAAVAVGVCIRE